jgi:glutaredoxin-related protein
MQHSIDQYRANAIRLKPRWTTAEIAKFAEVKMNLIFSYLRFAQTAGNFSCPEIGFGNAWRVLTLAHMETPQITAYLKTQCGWSAGVRAVLAKYNLKYTEKDIIQNPAFRWEMETKSGQPLSPCVEIDGEMLADVSGEEVEQHLTEHNLVQASDADAGVPTNAPCATEQHEGAVKLHL